MPSTEDALPDVAFLAEVADAGSHPSLRQWAPHADRLAAWREELTWFVDVATCDMDYARAFAEHLPISGAPVEAYLDRWLSLDGTARVLVGPRYRGRDPMRPFVDVVASDRILTVSDVPALRALARREFGEFMPGYVRLWTCEPASAWAGTGADLRLLAALLGRLRGRAVRSVLVVRQARDLSWYEEYAAVHDQQVAADPSHALHTRVEAREDLEHLRESGTLLEVRLKGSWAGVVAAEPRVFRGMRGASVVELLLAPHARGLGHGPDLSVLLARALPLPAQQLLFGTIHVDNTAAYRSALAAGRADVGGEVTIPLGRSR